MMTYRLWRALRSPPYAHPFFRRTAATRPPSLRRTSWTLMACAILLGILAHPGVFMPVVFLSPLLFILLGGTLYGAVWSSRIGAAISKAREQGTYELLCTAPGGALEASWVICAGRLHRHNALERSYDEFRWIVRLLLGITLFTGVAVLLTPSNYAQADSILIMTAILLLIVAAHIDFVQSAILSGMTGIIIASYAHRRVDARLWSPGCFLLGQIMSYLIVWFAGFLMLPALYQTLAMSGWRAQMSMLILRILIFYGVREIIVSVTWRIMIERLGANDNEFAIVTKAPARTNRVDNLEAVAQIKKSIL